MYAQTTMTFFHSVLRERKETMKQKLSQRLGDAITSVQETIQSTGNVFQDNVLSGLYSQENANFNPSQLDLDGNALRTAIFQSVKDLDGEDNHLAPLTLESECITAGLMIAAVAGNAAAAGKYHQRAMKSGEAGVLTMESLYSGSGGELEFMEAGNQYTQESFDSNVLGVYAPRSVLFNVIASRQDRFSEAWFETKAIAPSEGGLSISIDRQEVIPYETRAASGKHVATPRRNLLDAFVDHEILSRPSTELIPHAKADGSNDAYLVPAALVANKSRVVGDVTVTTRPLQMGKVVNMLGISSHPGLLDNGMMNTSDQIAMGGGLRSILMHLTDGTDSEVFEFAVQSFGRSQFKKSPEGKDREVVLNFRTDSLVLDANSKTITGTPSALLADQVVTPNYVVQLKVAITGHGSLNEGDFEINSGAITVARILNAANESISLEEGDGLAIVERFAALNAKFIGWEPNMRRSNTNWRTMGDLIDVSVYTEKYDIQPGYPISVISATSEEQTGAKLAGMVNANRVRTSNNALTTLINYAEHLEAAKGAIDRGAKIDLIGMGKHLVRPFYRKDDIDVVDRVRTRRSGELVSDICWVLVDALRDMAYRMYTEANYGPALEMTTGGGDVKPTIIIGCDPIVERYLNIVGDTRLLGDRFDVKLVSTTDKRMRDRVFMSFSRNQPGHIDCLGFGTHAIIPEMIQKITTDRDNTTFVQDRVIPRSMHIPVLPVLAELSIQNLKQAVNGQF